MNPNLLQRNIVETRKEALYTNKLLVYFLGLNKLVFALFNVTNISEKNYATKCLPRYLFLLETITTLPLHSNITKHQSKGRFMSDNTVPG